MKNYFALSIWALICIVIGLLIARGMGAHTSGLLSAAIIISSIFLAILSINFMLAKFKEKD
jgi:Mn2+/Fe2+ NRAMP family transporter